MSVEIKVGHSGSCPHSPKGIKKIKENEFLVYPQWRAVPGRDEEAEAGWGARLEIKILKTGRDKEQVTLHIDWQFPAKDHSRVETFRDFAYIKKGDEWVMIVPESIEGSIVTFVLDAPEGETEMAQYPAYNLPELKADLKRWQDKGALVSVYGKSENGLDLPIVKIGKKSPGKERVIVLLRNHAYESAASYCCRGIIDFLLKDAPLAVYLKSKFVIELFPMTNIDGIDGGMSRLTSPQGANLNRYETVKDKSVEAMMKEIERENPDLLLNYHNWQFKFQDGMWCKDEHYQKLITYYLSDIHRDYKRLDSYIVFKKEMKQGFEKSSLQDYLENKYGSTTVTFEFPWFGRTTARMEEVGERSFTAFLMARVEERQQK